MSQTDLMRGGIWISTNPVAAGTVSLSLPAPATGQCHAIRWITCYTNGGTILNLHVLKSDATSIARFGGVATDILGQPLRFESAHDLRGGLTGYLEDATLITLAGGGTASQLTAGWEYVPA